MTAESLSLHRATERSIHLTILQRGTAATN